MTLKVTRNAPTQQFHECALTGVVFDGQFTPLRVSYEGSEILLSFTDKYIDNAVFIDTDPKLINAILSGQRVLPSEYQALIKPSFKDDIINLYVKKQHHSLGFMLKTGQAVIGRRAIDRAMMRYDDKMPFAILLSEGGSQAICKSFQFKKSDLKIIENFSQELLKQVTGREKISYYCILNTAVGIAFYNDYKKYLKLIN